MPQTNGMLDSMISLEDIKRFLHLFCQSFSLNKRYAFRLTPDDPVDVIYQLYYRRGSKSGNAYEHAQFKRALADWFGPQLASEDALLDRSLGDLLDHLRHAYPGALTQAH